VQLHNLSKYKYWSGSLWNSGFGANKEYYYATACLHILNVKTIPVKMTSTNVNSICDLVVVEVVVWTDQGFQRNWMMDRVSISTLAKDWFSCSFQIPIVSW